MGNPRALLLDLDGTLVDSLPDLVAVLNEVLGAFGMPALSAAQAAPMVGDGTLKFVERALAARYLGRDIVKSAQTRFLALYEARPAQLSRPYPGVPEILEGLGAQDWRCAVCTNKPERATRLLLDALDLTRFFGAIITGDSLPEKKPDPAPLRAALAALKVPPSRAVMVGDHANDLRAAAAARIPCIFARYGYGVLPPDVPPPIATIDAFTDLPERLSAIPTPSLTPPPPAP
jgi:phosphoglycolate phosphatase